MSPSVEPETEPITGSSARSIRYGADQTTPSSPPSRATRRTGVAAGSAIGRSSLREAAETPTAEPIVRLFGQSDGTDPDPRSSGPQTATSGPLGRPTGTEAESETVPAPNATSSIVTVRLGMSVKR